MSTNYISPDWPAPINVRALTTTRAGGVSRSPYESLNLGDHVGDDAAAVRRNRELLRGNVGLSTEPVWLKQVHGIDVTDAATAPVGASADGAYVRKPGVVCAILTADCLPIFVCNRAGTAIGLFHAGWRGLVAGVVEAGLKAMRAPAEDLLVWLGPAISARAYEVGAEVREAFIARNAQAEEVFAVARPGKWYLDLYAAARQRLMAYGISAIYGGQYCTATQRELFFSHRRDGTTGRMASLIWLV